MEMPSVPLALEAFLPVLLLGWGLFFLARLIARLDRNCGPLASLGFLLITLAGFLHALWKLIWATTELNIPVLNHSLLILSTPGFVLMAWALWNTFHRSSSSTPVWVVPVIVIVIGCGAAAINALSKGGQRWFYILLGLTLLAQTAMALLLAWQAWQRGLPLVALLFLVYLVVVTAQSGWLRLRPPSLALQWIEQINSTLVGGIFAYAVWHLGQTIAKR